MGTAKYFQNGLAEPFTYFFGQITGGKGLKGPTDCIFV
jgi:hypothetical protein